LSQTLLKLTSPGVPDIYQGQELWDFSLVDPDNRRPVDYSLRRQLLQELETRAAGGDGALLALARELAACPRDQRIKLFVTWRTLQFRRQHGELFQTGRYLPLKAEGPRANHVCAFAWQLPSAPGKPEQIAIVIAPRLLARLTPLGEGGQGPPPPLGPPVWEDTRIVTEELAPWPLKNLFCGRVYSLDPSGLLLAEALSDFPVALLTNIR
jgi:(1->4)-alpha-D-glucan 1-alpha-D-glucosylmutase